MDVAGATEMLQHRDVPVEELQDEVVGALEPAAGGRIRGVARQLLDLVVHPADHAIDPAVHDRVGRAGEQRRRELLVEHDRAVAHLEDAGDGQADIAGLRRLAQLEGEARMRDVDLLLDPQGRGRVDQHLGCRHVAARALRRRVLDLAGVGRRRSAA